MKKALFILLLLVSLLPLFAGNHILDEAQLLTSEEFASASEILDYYSSECNMDLVFISIASSNGMTTDEYAKTYFEKQGYKDGAIYCLNLENYDFYIAFLGAAREKIIYEAVELIQDFALQFMDYEGYLGSITAFGKYSSVFIQDPEEALWAYDQYYSSLLSSRFVDDADLLTMAQEAAIGMYLEYYSEACSMDFVVVTVNSTNGKSARDYADDYMDEHGYNDGILYLLDMGNREWYVSTAGKAINIFTEDILDELESYIVYYLQNGDYYTSFLVFIDYAGGYSANNLDKESTWDYVEATGDENSNNNYGNYYGDTYNNYYDSYYDNYYNGYFNEEEVPVQFTIALTIILGAIGGSIIGIIVCFIQSRKHKNVKMSYNGDDYIVKDSFVLKDSSDIFLYSNVTKVARSSSSSSSSGHSSVHRSSGGHSHGGRGGHF